MVTLSAGVAEIEGEAGIDRGVGGGVGKAGVDHPGSGAGVAVIGGTDCCGWRARFSHATVPPSATTTTTSRAPHLPKRMPAVWHGTRVSMRWHWCKLARPS